MVLRRDNGACLTQHGHPPGVDRLVLHECVPGVTLALNRQAYRAPRVVVAHTLPSQS